jgi:glutaredoxin
METIIVYSKENCPACVMLKERLTKEGEPFSEVVVGVDMTQEAFRAKFPQVRSMPHMEMT